jgi:GYF domain 2
MYRVRGADQNVYGPIDAETVRQWIRERRLNGESQICRDGEEDWQKLGQLAEFSGDLSVPSAPAVPVVPGGSPVGTSSSGFFPSREAALVQVKPAAICMIVFGGLMCVLVLASAVMQLFSGGRQELPPNSPDWLVQLNNMQGGMPPAVQWVMLLLSAAAAGLVVFGGLKFLRLQSRGLVITAAILMMVPCFSSCCCLIGLGFGIWSLVLLNKPEIQAEFQ